MGKVKESFEFQTTEVLSSIEDAMLEGAAMGNQVDNYPEEAMPAATMIFHTVLLSNMWKLMEEENMDQSDRIEMAEKAGKELKKLIHTFTNLDTFIFHETSNE